MSTHTLMPYIYTWTHTHLYIHLHTHIYSFTYTYVYIEHPIYWLLIMIIMSDHYPVYLLNNMFLYLFFNWLIFGLCLRFSPKLFHSLIPNIDTVVLKSFNAPAEFIILWLFGLSLFLITFFFFPHDSEYRNVSEALD